MAKARKGFVCGGCGAPLSVDESGSRCGPCSRPQVVRAVRQVRAAYRPEPEALVVTDHEHGPGLCEDAPCCGVCRDALGLSVALPGSG